MSKVHISEVERAKKVKKIAERVGIVWSWMWKISALLLFITAVTASMIQWSVWGTIAILVPVLLLIGLVWLAFENDMASATLKHAERYGVIDD
jgi:hypothetical protein